MKFASNCHDPQRLSKVSRGFLAHKPAMPFGLAADWQYKGRTSPPFKMRRTINMPSLVAAPSTGLAGRLVIPGDKSMSHRAII